MKKKPLSRSATWWVYIIETEKGSLYTGITSDLVRRFRQHAGELKGGAKYFNGTAPVRFRFKQKCADRSSAAKMEAKIKRLSRSQKLMLIRGKRWCFEETEKKVALPKD